MQFCLYYAVILDLHALILVLKYLYNGRRYMMGKFFKYHNTRGVTLNYVDWLGELGY